LGLAGFSGAFVVTGFAGCAFAATFAERLLVTDFLTLLFLPILFLVEPFLPARFAAAFFATFLAGFLTAFFAVVLTAFLATFFVTLRPFFLEAAVDRRGADLRAALPAFFFFLAAVVLALAITLP
jgi:hypothetical protein